MFDRLIRYFHYKRKFEDVHENICNAMMYNKSYYVIFGTLEWLVYCSNKLTARGMTVLPIRKLDMTNDRFLVVNL